MNPKMETFQVGDRVRKSGDFAGMLGTVVEVREHETRLTTIGVRLDSGTMKYRTIAYWEKVR